MLRRAGYSNVTVFERADRLGGVWHHNTYPGAACDVPSNLYEFSFEPNPRWSHRYARQAEIQLYIEQVARKYGVTERVRTGTEVVGMIPDGLVLPAAENRLQLLDFAPSRLLTRRLAEHISARVFGDVQTLLEAIADAGDQAPVAIRDAALRLSGSVSPTPPRTE